MSPSGSNNSKQILVLGIGNLLMGDEGVGIHAIRHMENHPFPDNIRLLDGGTGGFNLLSFFDEYNPVILIDATMDGDVPGSLHILRPRFSSEFPKSLSSHDIGLKDLIESAVLTDNLPEIYLITISINTLGDLKTELSPELSRALPDIEKNIRKILTYYQ